ncbi:MULTISPECIES: hypothetical protein [unclassified Caballeronia]|uniref:hypothetical protein n=1 Tax=unclassified Caballeronia TaxID=2646786 RepID=UPI002866B378|nr:MULTISPECIES: hypothetical protein [unclassified Caballeronia]MDR5776709.1 hypothetical protein [Caballeronia sp. LZ002]MDR5802340.1 hypothetical protein [Caballeronia sp. LZ001]MDR5852132.1 hypothetical protein [Caballeronia sp. LZ003]
MSEQGLNEGARNAADDKVHRWVAWCLTRRIFAPYVKSNVLARLQPARRAMAREPDSFLDPEMPFFNMAIHALCEQGGRAHEAECFLGVYWYNANIKTLAYEQNCARGTIYNRARRFAERAESLSKSIRRASESFMSEKCSRIIEQNSSTAD